MDLWDGPAALGGIMMCVALGAWTLGRWQGGLAVSEDATAHAPTSAGDAAPALPDPAVEGLPTPCPLDALAARRAVLAVADPLGELHAEVSAYRRSEQVLAGAGPDELVLRHSGDATDHPCRHLGVTGELVCGLTGTAHLACATRTSTARTGSACGSQPSAASFDPLRV